MRKQCNRASKSAVVCILLLFAPYGVHADNAKLDILGIRIGDTAEDTIANLAKATTSEPSITKQPCAVEQHTKRGRCIARIDARIDETTLVEIKFVEDYPTRPGTSVVSDVEASYRYDTDGKGPRRPSLTEYKASLIAKYGAPIESDETYGRYTWGHVRCRKRHECPPQNEYLEFRSAMRPIDSDTLELADPVESGRRSRAASNAAEASRLVGKPKF